MIGAYIYGVLIFVWVSIIPILQYLCDTDPNIICSSQTALAALFSEVRVLFSEVRVLFSEMKFGEELRTHYTVHTCIMLKE